MKKIFLFLAVASASFFASCSSDDDAPSYIDNDTYAESFDVNVNLTLDATGRYSVLVPLDPPIFNSDVVLVYRRMVDNEGFTVWQPIPNTIFLGGTDEVNYDFNFRPNDVSIIADGTINLAANLQFINNQTFRIVLVPAFVAQNVDTNNIDAVMSAVQEYKNGGVPSIE